MNRDPIINPNTHIWDGIINTDANLSALVADLLEISIDEVLNLEPNKTLTVWQEDIIFSSRGGWTISEEMEDIDCNLDALVKLILDMRNKI